MKQDKQEEVSTEHFLSGDSERDHWIDVLFGALPTNLSPAEKIRWLELRVTNLAFAIKRFDMWLYAHAKYRADNNLPYAVVYERILREFRDAIVGLDL